MIAIDTAIALTLWEDVPHRVRSLYKQASPVAMAVQRVAKHMPGVHSPMVWFDPENKHVYVSLQDTADDAQHNYWHNAMQAIPGVQGVKADREWVPQNAEDCVRIKLGVAPLEFIGRPWTAANSVLGGPSPLSSAIVGGLVGGGAGYLGGAAAEHLFPERYVERGRLRRTLGMLGMGLGAAPGLAKGMAAWQNSAAAGQPLGMKSFITPDTEVPFNPQRVLPAAPVRDDVQDLQPDLRGIALTPHYEQTIAKMAAAMFPDNTGAFNVPSVPVDAFNHAVWTDVRRGAAQYNPYGTKDPWGSNEQPLHTPPAIGAAISGVMSGVASQHGGGDLVSPGAIVHGIASMGVGLATANMAGRTLGALGGLKPEAQNRLQDMGIWAGLLSDVAQSIF